MCNNKSLLSNTVQKVLKSDFYFSHSICLSEAYFSVCLSITWQPRGFSAELLLHKGLKYIHLILKSTHKVNI